jgi:hypothetical protein
MLAKSTTSFRRMSLLRCHALRIAGRPRGSKYRTNNPQPVVVRRQAIVDAGGRCPDLPPTPKGRDTKGPLAPTADLFLEIALWN